LGLACLLSALVFNRWPLLMTSLLSRYLVSLPQPHLSPCGFAHLFGFVCARSLLRDAFDLERLPEHCRFELGFASIFILLCRLHCGADFMPACPLSLHSILGGAASPISICSHCVSIRLSQFDQMFTLIGIELGCPFRIPVHGASSRMHSGRSSHFGIQSGQPRIAFHIAPFTLTLLFEKGGSALASPS